VTADLVRQVLQEQTTELTVILSASTFQQLRVFVMVPLDAKDSALEAEGLQRALSSVIAAAAAMDRLSPSPDGFRRESGKGRDPLANVALK